MAGLDARELEILNLLSSGMSEREACARLGIDEKGLDLAWGQIAQKLEGFEPKAIPDYDLILRYERIERRRLEGEVWANEARLNALMDTAPEAVFVINGRSGRILKCNNQALTMFGYSPRELIGHEMEMLLAQDLKQIHIAYRNGFLNSVRKREMGYHPPIEAFRKDGTALQLDIALTATQATDDVMVVCRPVAVADTPSVLEHSAE